MNIAVMTLTRDRLKYTTACFAKLKEMAGCSFNHFVVDNGSRDGTQVWLEESREVRILYFNGENLGLAAGLNQCLDLIENTETNARKKYDVIVKFDNDCLPLTDRFLVRCAKFVLSHPKAVCSPRVEGLGKPPAYKRDGVAFGESVMEVGHLGGICHIAPRAAYDGFMWDEQAIPLARGADSYFSAHLRRNGWRQYYLLDVVVEHYMTTKGQEADPEMQKYFERKRIEETARP